MFADLRAPVGPTRFAAAPVARRLVSFLEQLA
jgi:hypothetical protein